MSEEHCKEWKAKLVGKTCIEEDEQTTLSEGEFFRRSDLPKPSRVVGPDSLLTMDYRPERLNVQIDFRKICTDVTLG
ncbi:hypothetical protein BY458DRAFT_558193 [Sporodiniella umbellata]|nr:hypothetical protein BY458DRAFT_558193 [Sporodiniella umbellata]